MGAENTTTRIVQVDVDNAEYNAKIEESAAKGKALRGGGQAEYRNDNYLSSYLLLRGNGNRIFVGFIWRNDAIFLPFTS